MIYLLLCSFIYCFLNFHLFTTQIHHKSMFVQVPTIKRHKSETQIPNIYNIYKKFKVKKKKKNSFQYLCHQKVLKSFVSKIMDFISIFYLIEFKKKKHFRSSKKKNKKKHQKENPKKLLKIRKSKIL